jgi:hypothetical protein
MAVCAASLGLVKLTFVTARLYNGFAGGTAPYHEACRVEASGAGLPGYYMAWISTNPPGDYPYATFVHSVVPYVLPDGTTVVAANWAQLLTGSLSHPIDMHPDGTAAVAGNVWTGTGTNGYLDVDGVAGGQIQNDCNGWQYGLLETGTTGASNEDSPLWTFNGWETCDKQYPIYCFQQ